MARIHRQTTVVRDGMHNAFTDLVYWRGAYWVSYRKGASHVSPDGVACVSVSVDRQRFTEAGRIKTAADDRDPKLLVMDDHRLALYFASWVEPPGQASSGHLRQYLALSGDGFNWDRPSLLMEQRWLWRIRRHEGRFYGLSYGPPSGQGWRDGGTTLELHVSDDLHQWETLAQIGAREHDLNETDIHFRPDGEAWVVARSGKAPGYSFLCAAKPPYTQWELMDLGVAIHAPAMVEHEGALYVAGRRRTELEGEKTFPFLASASLGLWRVERGKVAPVLYIPATGDCSYPGLIVDPQGRICMSYYSQHAYDMGVLDHVYLRHTTEPHNTGQLLPQDDVYFAELELP